MEQPLQHQVTMYYDGGCPLCAREVAHYKRVDKAQNVRWLDINSDPSALSEINVDREAALQRLHVTDTEGKLVTGAPAFQVIWSALPGYRWLARLVSPRPVLKFADVVYNVFAKRRYNNRCGAICSTGAED